MLRRRRLRRLATGVGLVYLGIFLFAIGDINIHLAGGGPVDAYLVPDAIGRMFDRRSAFYFEAIGVVTLPHLTWLVSPANILLGGVLGGLVGINAALAYLAWRQPQACRVRSGSGLLAAIPGLLAGSACCAPTLLLVLGVPASASLLALFGLMVPVAFLLLILGAMIVSRRVDPAFAERA